MMKSCYDYQTPLGLIRIVENGHGVTAISLIAPGQMADGYAVAETELIKRTSAQLHEYFAGTRKVFDLPLVPEGTPFQRKVWDVLCSIPYGQTCTYGEVAAAAGNPKASRAVGMANNRNPLLIVVPCHRVIGSGGKLVGYACGLDKKEFLLDLEHRNAG